MIIPGRKVLIFPVEEIVRELDFRLVLAALCARPDNQIILGNHTDVYELGKRLRGGLYVGKNLLNVSPTRMTECYEHLKEQRIRVVHLDEEGAFFQGGEEDWKERLLARLDPAWMEGEDFLCTWGTFQADYYRSRGTAITDHVRVTGHPRFNLHADPYGGFYAAESEKFRRDYGPFILVNTNFKYCNHGKGPDFYLRNRKVEPGDSEQRTFLVDHYGYSARKMAHFIELINHLSDSFPDYGVVLRPHPTESTKTYEEMFRHIPRVRIERMGSLSAWLHACELLIHDGCTTGLEAHIAGTKVINYRPVRDSRFDFLVTNLVGRACENEEQVVAAIRDFREGIDTKSLPAESHRAIKRVLENYDETTEAFERLADLILDVLEEVEPTEVTGELSSFTRRGKVEAVKRKLRGIRPAFLGKYQPRNLFGYYRFPGLFPETINRKLGVAGELAGRTLTPRFFSSKLMSVHVE